MTDLTRLQARNEELERENRKLKETNNKLVAENVRLKRQVIQYCPKRVNQALKRKEEVMQKQKARYAELKTASAGKTTKKTEKKLKELQQEMKRVRDAKRKQTERFIAKKRTSLNKASDAHIEALKRATQHVQHLRSDLNTLEEQLSTTSGEDDKVRVKSDGKTFSNNIREASYNLQALGLYCQVKSFSHFITVYSITICSITVCYILSQYIVSQLCSITVYHSLLMSLVEFAVLLGVAEAKIGEVIEVVCSTVAHKSVDGPLPSTVTQGRMASEMKALSREQIREAVGEACL